MTPQDRAYYISRRDEWLERALKSGDQRATKEYAYMAERYDRLAKFSGESDDVK
ncbi:hypothetical protein [Pseudomonas sp.]|uniref:hypothetical protein n=1 Tax=Pseudomonas sp. TaxID=306 RepID=UPI0025EC1C2E|nr:hypothetical protein [Pseudomonas sp.]